jgi:hypothetical protein
MTGAATIGATGATPTGRRPRRRQDQGTNREVLESIQDYLRERQVYSAAIAPLDWVVRQRPK